MAYLISAHLLGADLHRSPKGAFTARSLSAFLKPATPALQCLYFAYYIDDIRFVKYSQRNSDATLVSALHIAVVTLCFTVLRHAIVFVTGEGTLTRLTLSGSTGSFTFHISITLSFYISQ